MGSDIHGKTVSIIGTGKIGQLTVQIFRGFGSEVIAVDSIHSNEYAQINGIRYIALDQMLYRKID